MTETLCPALLRREPQLGPLDMLTHATEVAIIALCASPPTGRARTRRLRPARRYHCPTSTSSDLRNALASLSARGGVTDRCHQVPCAQRATPLMPINQLARSTFNQRARQQSYGRRIRANLVEIRARRRVVSIGSPARGVRLRTRAWPP